MEIKTCNLDVLYNPPSPDEYRLLRLEAGLSAKSRKAAVKGLRNSLFSVAVYHEGDLAAMGRVIGDGGAFFQIVYIAVKPIFQGNGLGKLVMRELMAYLDEHTFEGSYVSLIADDPANKLYEQFGFTYTFPSSHGMYKRY